MQTLEIVAVKRLSYLLIQLFKILIFIIILMEIVTLGLSN